MSELLHVNRDGAPTLLQKLLQYGAGALEIWCRSWIKMCRNVGAPETVELSLLFLILETEVFSI